MEMRSGADPDMDPKELEEKQIVRLHQLLHEAKFKDPDGAHLSPAGIAQPSRSSKKES
jgi:DNA topoisomerase-6 subunit B